jgi:hypothetical protein
MLHKVQAWQTGTESSPSGGQFFTVCPIFYSYWENNDQNDGVEFAADWVIAWTLKDANNNAISSDQVVSLFGIGNSNKPVSFVDQNNPLAAAGYGWYCDIANNAVTTPFDAFMNWGEGVPSYSPRILVTQLPEHGQLYDASVEVGLFNSTLSAQFAAAAADDLPPAALVTLEPSVLNFGSVPVGHQTSLTAVLTNNQQNALGEISAATTTSTFQTLSISELQSGASQTITVDFLPRTAGPQSGTITFTTQGQYGPITLTLQCTGIGV